MNARRTFKDDEADRAVAHSRLMAAIAVQLEVGGRVPCVGRAELWQSEDAADLEAAAFECASCPALEACRRYVTEHPEPSGTWAAMVPSERKTK